MKWSSVDEGDLLSWSLNEKNEIYLVVKKRDIHDIVIFDLFQVTNSIGGDAAAKSTLTKHRRQSGNYLPNFVTCIKQTQHNEEK